MFHIGLLMASRSNLYLSAKGLLAIGLVFFCANVATAKEPIFPELRDDWISLIPMPRVEQERRESCSFTILQEELTRYSMPLRAVVLGRISGMPLGKVRYRMHLSNKSIFYGETDDKGQTESVQNDATIEELTVLWFGVCTENKPVALEDQCFI